MLVFIYFLPLFSPVDSETDAAPEYDYAPDEQLSDDQPLSAELPGKQNPLDAFRYHLFILPPACIRIATALLYPILMHSLSL
jgi:hypothetical protein